MDELARYLSVPYVDHGRGADGMDCWGLVREVLHKVYGGPLLPAHDDVAPDDKPRLTQRAELQVEASFHEVDRPQAGDLAVCRSGSAVVHIGIAVTADRRLQVLHTARKHGAVLTRIAVFERLFNVRWIRHGKDQGLSG